MIAKANAIFAGSMDISGLTFGKNSRVDEALKLVETKVGFLKISIIHA